MPCDCRYGHTEPADCPDLHDEIRRLESPDLGFPHGLAVYLAQRAHSRGWLPVEDPMLPAGPANVRPDW